MPISDIYLNSNLDLKSDPDERFEQALDESGASGRFRSLITKHFSTNWKYVFGNELGFENALNNACTLKSDAEKSISLWYAIPRNSTLNIELQRFVWPESFKESHSKSLNELPIIQFAIDIANEFFSCSPYSLYTSKLGDALKILPYGDFIAFLYGKEKFHSDFIFEDETLASAEPHNRSQILSCILESYIPCMAADYEQSNVHEISHLKQLIDAISWSCNPGPPTKEAKDFLIGIQFLKNWVSFEAKVSALDSIYSELYGRIQKTFYSLENILSGSDDNAGFENEVLEMALEWSQETRSDLQLMFYTSIDTRPLSSALKVDWASGLEQSFDHSLLYKRKFKAMNKGWPYRVNEYLPSVLSWLNQDQIETWIHWTVKSDIESVATKDEVSYSSGFKRSEIWWSNEHYVTCKDKFESEIKALPYEKKRTALTENLPIVHQPFCDDLYDWWDNLLFSFISASDFPRNALPDWTIALFHRLGNSKLLPYVEQSIGILRAQLSSDWDLNKSQQLKQLLEKLEFIAPQKSLKHQLLLMRASKKPLFDGTLSVFHSEKEKSLTEWYRPLRDISKIWVQGSMNADSKNSDDSPNRDYVDHLMLFQKDLAEFCLSRLRLRKRQKAIDGKYTNEQVTETSPEWRQAYIKALQELGLDLGGNFHKTLHFIKQSDPDDNVRKFAKDSYRAVKREKKSLTSTDLNRSIIAADWWLRLGQLNGLGIEEDEKEAIKTRRNMMRNP